MNAVVFAGPTIAAHDVSAIVDAVCLPPAAHGDLYRAALRRPRVIGLIDGYFERQPAVWHKEILWAMHEGIHVFGSASMGALRAAELAPFGMVGVGAIFEAYRDEAIEDDDEVAVAHGPEETGYRAGSDAMVNIRATLARARTAGALNEAVSVTLERIAKDLFYAERTWAHVLERGRDEGLPAAALEAFRRWLPSGSVNQKRDDAVAMLQAMRALLESDAAPKQVDFVFEESLWWWELRSNAAETGLHGDDARVLETLARDPIAWEHAVTGALGWHAAGLEAARDGRPIDAASLVDQAAELCRRHGLSDAGAVDRWLMDNRYTRGQLEQLLDASARARQATALAGDVLTPALLQYLRWTGDYRRLLG
jgi:hypothetical protein